MEMSLPDFSLGETPIRHPDCCLSLSSKLLAIITSLFAPSDRQDSSCSPTLLSVGSGSGLLESLLHIYSQSDRLAGEPSPAPRLSVEGVEVQQPPSRPPVNKYLSEQFHHTVRGTWDLSARVVDGDVVGLMFVYPRQHALVSRYVETVCQAKSNISVIVWLGPMADWAEFRSCFDRQETGDRKECLSVEALVGSEAGLGDYEMVAIVRRCPG